MKKFWLVLWIIVGLCNPLFAGKTRVAVLDFDASGIQSDYRTGGGHWSNNDISTGVTDMFTTALFKTGRFELVERNQIQKVIDEQGFGSSGLVNPATAAKMGRILGVSAIITGKVTEFGTRQFEVGIAGFGGQQTEAKCAIDCRMIDTTTGSILIAETSEAGDSQVGVSVAEWHNLRIGGQGFDSTLIGKVTRKAVNKLVDRMVAYAGKNVAGKVASVTSEKVIINLGKNSGFVEGDILEIFRVGEAVVDPDTGEILEQAEAKMGEIKITQTKEKSSEAQIVSGSGQIQIKDVVRVKEKAK